MVLSDRALATSYRLSIVTCVSSSAVVSPQFLIEGFKLSSRISETVKDRTKLPINH